MFVFKRSIYWKFTRSADRRVIPKVFSAIVKIFIVFRLVARFNLSNGHTLGTFSFCIWKWSVLEKFLVYLHTCVTCVFTCFYVWITHIFWGNAIDVNCLCYWTWHVKKTKARGSFTNLVRDRELSKFIHIESFFALLKGCWWQLH